MKRNLLALLMIAGLIFATSCKDDPVEEPTLTLSEAEWAAPMEAAEKAVTVTTNQTNWTAAPNAEWVETTQSGNTLTIKVAKNLETKARKAVVKVIAGGLGKDIVVMQAATNVTIVTIPDKLEVDQWGGNYVFDVDANTQDWTVTSDAEWAKVTGKPFKGEVAIEVDANAEREVRTAKLVVAGGDGKTMKEFLLTQKGIMYHILPYLVPGAPFDEVQRFELDRKSVLMMDIDVIFGGPYLFSTISPAFPYMQYAFTSNSVSQIAATAASSEVLKDPEFDKMMTEEGFAKDGNNYTKEVTVNGTESIILAEVIIGDDEAGVASGVLFSFIPKQPKPMPTWDKMPLGYTGFGKGAGKDIPEIDAYEAENGGKYNAETSAEQQNQYWYHWFDVGTPELLARAYFVMNDPAQGLVETAQYYLDREKVFYEANGTLFVTNEFKALAEKEGFNYIGLSGGWHRFLRSDITFITRWVKYSDIDVPVLDIHVFVPAGSSASVKRGLPDLNDSYKPFEVKNSWEARGFK